MHLHVLFPGLSDGTWTHGLYHPKVARYHLRHTQISCENYITITLWKMQAFFQKNFFFFSFPLFCRFSLLFHIKKTRIREDFGVFCRKQMVKQVQILLFSAKIGNNRGKSSKIIDISRYCAILLTACTAVFSTVPLHLCIAGKPAKIQQPSAEFRHRTKHPVQIPSKTNESYD